MPNSSPKQYDSRGRPIGFHLTGLIVFFALVVGTILWRQSGGQANTPWLWLAAIVVIPVSVVVWIRRSGISTAGDPLSSERLSIIERTLASIGQMASRIGRPLTVAGLPEGMAV